MSDKQIKEMSLWYIIVMHEPIKDSDGDPSFLSVFRDGYGRWLGAYGAEPGDRWSREDGFAFVAPQDTLKSDTSTTDFIKQTDVLVRQAIETLENVRLELRKFKQMK